MASVSLVETLLTAETLRFHFSSSRRHPITTSDGTVVGETRITTGGDASEMQVLTPQGEVSWLALQRGRVSGDDCVFWVSSADRFPLGALGLPNLWIGNEIVACVESSRGVLGLLRRRYRVLDYERAPLAITLAMTVSHPKVTFVAPMDHTLRKLIVLVAYARWLQREDLKAG
jgi:hypothetical protein